MNTELMFSSATDNWATPQKLFDELDAEFHFTLDACATESNAKCSVFYSPETDGLSQVWTGTVWVNPPYGRTTKEWVHKAFYYSRVKEATVVMLLPARTDTQWFHRYIYNKPDVEVRLLKGRLTFGTDEYWQWVWTQPEINGKKNTLYGKTGKKNSAPFPSMIVIFKPTN